MHIVFLTLFPDQLRTYFLKGIFGRAAEKNLFQISFINIRDYSKSKHKRVDEYPYGHRQGMILQAEAVSEAIYSIDQYSQYRLLYACPKGPVFTQKKVYEYLQEPKGLILLSGYYEGIDERLFQLFPFERVSLGDFVLSSGELPSLAVAEAVLRTIPGVVGNPQSVEADSILSGVLEHPHYAAPRSYQGLEVPEVLLNGNHQAINEWKLKQSIKDTLFCKPKLLAQKPVSPAEQDAILQALEGEKI